MLCYGAKHLHRLEEAGNKDKNAALSSKWEKRLRRFLIKQGRQQAAEAEEREARAAAMRASQTEGGLSPLPAVSPLRRAAKGTRSTPNLARRL